MSNNLLEDIRTAQLRHEQYVKQTEQFAMKTRESTKPTIPIWEKVAMTLQEAAEYSSIGRDTLREITDDPACSFVFWVGNKRLIKRTAFEEYINNLRTI